MFSPCWLSPSSPTFLPRVLSHVCNCCLPCGFKPFPHSQPSHISIGFPLFVCNVFVTDLFLVYFHAKTLVILVDNFGWNGMIWLFFLNIWKERVVLRLLWLWDPPTPLIFLWSERSVGIPATVRSKRIYPDNVSDIKSTSTKVTTKRIFSHAGEEKPRLTCLRSSKFLQGGVNVSQFWRDLAALFKNLAKLLWSWGKLPARWYLWRQMKFVYFLFCCVRPPPSPENSGGT